MHVDFYPIPDPASRKHKPSPDFRPKWLKFIPNFNPVNKCPLALLILYLGEGGNSLWGGGTLPKGGTFFKHQVFERVGKSVILLIKKGLKGLADAFYGCDKVVVNVLVL